MSEYRARAAPSVLPASGKTPRPLHAEPEAVAPEAGSAVQHLLWVIPEPHRPSRGFDPPDLLPGHPVVGRFGRPVEPALHLISGRGYTEEEILAEPPAAGPTAVPWFSVRGQRPASPSGARATRSDSGVAAPTSIDPCRAAMVACAPNRAGAEPVTARCRSGPSPPPMTNSSPDPERTPVVIASGQSIERTELVTPVDLMERACEAALADVPALRQEIERVSVVNIMTPVGPAPATELATRIGAAGARSEVSTIGGSTPQWLVNRAASQIADGSLAVTLIAGAEAIRSYRGRRSEGLPRDPGATHLRPDPIVGDDRPGAGPAESAIGFQLPVHVYALFESVVASRAGHNAADHRRAMGLLLAPFTRVAADNRYAWFPTARTATAIATPAPDNRIVSEPYTKLMTAFLGSDQGAALIVCSLGAARRAGVADRSVFIWSGAEAADVRFPTARPDPGRSPGIEAAGRAALAAASAAAGSPRTVGIDDISVLDIYSCFPSAVELACAALGLAGDDGRGLTVTGGLPYFGGPGNNYATHGIATITDILRGSSDTPGSTADGGGSGPRLGLATGLSWYITKHAVGIYGTEPPPGGFHRGDTTADQTIIDDSAVEIALEVDQATAATVVGATVVRDGEGVPQSAPLIATLPDGRRMALAAADQETLEAVGGIDVPALVGEPVAVQPGPARYRLATD